jgi:hypothetical protein
MLLFLSRLLNFKALSNFLIYLMMIVYSHEMCVVLNIYIMHALTRNVPNNHSLMAHETKIWTSQQFLKRQVYFV